MLYGMIIWPTISIGIEIYTLILGSHGGVNQNAVIALKCIGGLSNAINFITNHFNSTSRTCNIWGVSPVHRTSSKTQ